MTADPWLRTGITVHDGQIGANIADVLRLEPGVFEEQLGAIRMVRERFEYTPDRQPSVADTGLTI